MNAEVYKQIYTELFNLQPRWKQIAIVEDIASKKTDSGILDEFILNVISTAEKSFDDKKNGITAPVNNASPEEDPEYKDSCDKNKCE